MLSFAFIRFGDAKFEGFRARIGVWRGRIAGFRFSESNAQFASERIAGKIGR